VPGHSSFSLRRAPADPEVPGLMVHDTDLTRQSAETDEIGFRPGQKGFQEGNLRRGRLERFSGIPAVMHGFPSVALWN